MDFLVDSSRGEKMKTLIFTPGSAAWTKSKQLHQLQRQSFILTAQRNGPYAEGAGRKALHNADILSFAAALLPG